MYEQGWVTAKYGKAEHLWYSSAGEQAVTLDATKETTRRQSHDNSSPALSKTELVLDI